MAVTAWKSPGTFGTRFDEWAKGGRGLAEDGFFATCDPGLTTGDEESYEKFLFSIPTTDNIDGIELQVKADRAETGTGTGLRAQLYWHNGLSYVDEGSTQDLAEWGETGTFIFHSVGGATDLWGSSGWTPGKINGNGFGVRLLGIPSGGAKLDVDVSQIRIYHSAPGAVVPVAMNSYRRRRIG